jgi:hypothetical protein
MGCHIRFKQKYVSNEKENNYFSLILIIFLNRVIQVWEEIFFKPLFDCCSIEQCPMLIGITRRSAREKDWLSEYQFKVLLKGDTTCIQGKSSRETVLNELVNFKEEFDDNEQILVSFYKTQNGTRKILISFIDYVLVVRLREEDSSLLGSSS